MNTQNGPANDGPVNPPNREQALDQAEKGYLIERERIIDFYNELENGRKAISPGYERPSDILERMANTNRPEMPPPLPPNPELEYPEVPVYSSASIEQLNVGFIINVGCQRFPVMSKAELLDVIAWWYTEDRRKAMDDYKLFANSSVKTRLQAIPPWYNYLSKRL